MRTMFATIFAVSALAAAPALAQDPTLTQDRAPTTAPETTGSIDKEPGQDETRQGKTVHPPTNRVGESVPSMLEATQGGEGRPVGAEGGPNKPETIHPPTNRVGKAVPTMTNGENEPKPKIRDE